jgi:hypothetical protein
MILEIFLLIIGIVIGLANFMSWLSIVINANTDIRNCVLVEIEEFVAFLFQQRNTFGILLSVFVFIALLPSFILALLSQCLYWFFGITEYIWELGKKKSE